MTDKMREEFAKLKRHERQGNAAESRYWCKQYRLFAERLLKEQAAQCVPVVGEVVAYACPFHASNQFVNGTPCMLVEAVSVNGYGKERGFPLVVQPTHSISAAELELMRQWFDCVQDVNGGFLNHDDFILAKKLYEIIGMRVPHSIIDAAIAAEGEK